MAKANTHNHIVYIEFSTTDIVRTKVFYGKLFGWEFKDWGPDYIDTKAENSGVALGFSRIDKAQKPAKNAPLVVLYSDEIEATEKAIVAAGGEITTPIFAYPGGRRFHFNDGMGNILAVCSEPDTAS